MPNTTSLAKALIINLDQGGQRVSCLFNPTEYTFSKQNTWVQGGTSGKDMPQLEFSSGQPATLQMQLFFDTYAERNDVRTAYTDGIWELMSVDESLRDPKTQKARPPMVRFQWGKNWSFDAVITSITQKFTLFLDDGTPVRATLDVTFQQVKDTRQLRPQNPTSGGDGGERVWNVGAGDTLAWIAYKSYGDSTRWRAIADANALSHIRRLTPGMVLVIPND
ncbi:MAG: LysM peptidoglycan-binding domain-containing protein [Chloroflexaceae bacterium]|jgi:predicted Zn-dependent protease|nr:LysM peptidoglycan-binding domain-containing protein [Chloroflexaceae bacterium]